MNRTLLLLTACAAATIAEGQRPSDGGPKIGSATVCEILTDPLRYDGRLLKVSGRFAGTDEGSWIVGDGCPGVFVTEGHVWPSEIALTNPEAPSRQRLHTVDFQLDPESERRAHEKYQHLRETAPEKCIRVSITGLFETRKNWPDAKMKYPDGTSKYAGFGHLGEAPGQLLVKSQDEVTIVSGCPVGPALDPPEAIRDRKPQPRAETDALVANLSCLSDQPGCKVHMMIPFYSHSDANVPVFRQCSGCPNSKPMIIFMKLVEGNWWHGAMDFNDSPDVVDRIRKQIEKALMLEVNR